MNFDHFHQFNFDHFDFDNTFSKLIMINLCNHFDHYQFKFDHFDLLMLIQIILGNQNSESNSPYQIA